jgi:hypothetical protein
MPSMAANLLTSVMLCSSPTTGIDTREVEYCKDSFGSNANNVTFQMLSIGHSC